MVPGEQGRAACCFTSELVGTLSAQLFISKALLTAVVLACLDPTSSGQLGNDGEGAVCAKKQNAQVLSVVLKA